MSAAMACLAPVSTAARKVSRPPRAVSENRVGVTPVASAASARVTVGRGGSVQSNAPSTALIATLNTRRGSRLIPRGAENDDKPPVSQPEDGDDEFTVAGTAKRVRDAKAKAKAGVKPGRAGTTPASEKTVDLSDLNPLNLGKKSRQFVDGVFKAVSGLTQFTRSPSFDEAKYELYDADLLSGEGLTEFTNPNARFTTVLVIGAAGRVGRVLVRKLLLRGYTVKALVRNQADAENLPTAVDARFGDVSDASAMESGTCFGGFPKLRHWLVRTVFARTSHGKKMHRW
tara:strand:- start:5013 stop:5870 length:858 start_codon:yes stop_codon:yes gene_type:complete